REWRSIRAEPLRSIGSRSNWPIRWLGSFLRLFLPPRLPLLDRFGFRGRIGVGGGAEVLLGQLLDGGVGWPFGRPIPFAQGVDQLADGGRVLLHGAGQGGGAP